MISASGIKNLGLTGKLCFVFQLTKADYSLPTLGPKLVELYNEVNQGRGFQFLRFVGLYTDLYFQSLLSDKLTQ